MNTQRMTARRMLRGWLKRHWQPREDDQDARRPIDVAVLEDRTLYSGTPLMLDAAQIVTAEDAPDTQLFLPDLFSLDDQGGTVEYSIVDNFDPELFSNVTIDAEGNLWLDYAADQYGAGNLRIQAMDQQQQLEVLPLQVLIESVNDAPTAKGLNDINVNAGAGRTTIDLFDAFDDLEDADQDLTFSVAENTNSGLFSSIRINEQRGQLILEFAPDATGTADLTIVATDTGGLSAGLSAQDGFAVYDEIEGYVGVHTPDAEALGLSRVALRASGFFFDYVDGQLQYDQLNVERLRNWLHDPSLDDVDVPLVLDIENSYYVNTPEGRDRFAEVIFIANQERPDLEIGFYRFLPECSWHHPVRQEMLDQHQELGIFSWYTQNAERFSAGYETWLANNALYRTEPVSAEYGGQPLADMVDAVHPSLYTVYRNIFAEPIWRSATLDADRDTITGEGQSFEHVEQVRVTMATDASLPADVIRYQRYYVINADGSTFQIAETPDGLPIDIGEDFAGRIYVGDAGPWENPLEDPNVLNWRIYAEQNVAEARKYDKPVYAWISPSMGGNGAQHMEGDFFRMQLEILKPLVDGIMIYEPATQTADYHLNQGWWRALEDFTDTLDEPTTTFTVSVSAPHATNQVPVAASDTFSGREDVPLTWTTAQLLANDHEPDGQQLSLANFSQPQHGSLVKLAGGQLQYVPDADYFGADSFTYRVSDGELVSNAATVTLQIAPVNDSPQARGDRLDVLEDQVLTIDAGELLDNDHDVDQDPLNIRIVEGPQHGTLQAMSGGEYQYTPDADYSGTDHFVYRVNDGELGSGLATVRIDVLPVDDRPAKAREAYTTAEDERLVLRPSDLLPEGSAADLDQLRIRLVDDPNHGRLRITAGGAIVYAPQRDFHGLDQFGYRILDPEGHASVVAVQVRVTPEDDQPVARNDVYRVQSGERLRITGSGVLQNDREVDGETLRARLLRGPAHGSLHLRPDGSFVYRPDSSFHGLDRFRYLALDEAGGRSIGEVTVRVNPESGLTSALPTHGLGNQPLWKALFRRGIGRR